MSKIVRAAVLLPLFLAVSGCASIGVTLAGLGAGVGTNHYLNNVTSRTFTEPLASVQNAVFAALERMAISIEAREEKPAGVLITAKAGVREVEIELESVTVSATRMSSVARKEGALLLDSATSAEIIAQTEKLLAQSKTTRRRAGSGAPSSDAVAVTKP
ncbi:MAG TPA: DUF3568 family protein [Burkholderiales bacterium]|nr:DUF3568 family protein [Burkholderiales bacterium]